jgi:Ni/Fe-hydrogenase 1 B-type cytochrome subunit
MVLLILSGFYIYAPNAFRIFPSMDVARYIHFIFMYFIGWTLVYKFYYSIATGEIRELIFTWKDLKGLPGLIKHYTFGIFVGHKKPEWGKYNPGQKLLYTAWPILLIIQGITGIGLYFVDTFAVFNSFLGGLGNIRAWHFIISWIFTVTTVAHIYLGSTGPKFFDYYKSVVTGYEIHE